MDLPLADARYKARSLSLFAAISGGTLTSATFRACVICWLRFSSSWTMVTQHTDDSLSCPPRSPDTWCICADIDGTTEKSFPTHFLSLCLLLSEAMAFSCFTELMKRMNQNFPHGGAMDTHFANMRSLIQVTQPQ